VFVVSQVDEEGYVVQDAFVEGVKNLYTEDALKTLVEKVAPDCITGANESTRTKGK